MGVYPPSIQSFLTIHREKRSNFAQRGPTNIHTFENLTRERALTQGNLSF